MRVIAGLSSLAIAASFAVALTPAHGAETCMGEVVPPGNTGTSGNDNLAGTEGHDVFWAGAGDDIVSGLGGNDFICLGEGNDTAYGGAGFNTFEPGPGDDTLVGNASTQADEVRYTAAAQAVEVNLLSAQAYGEGTDTLTGIRVVRGSAFNDLIVGDDGSDWLMGGGGGDVLVGRMGEDSLEGGVGSDVLDGDEGDDHLFGGADPDTIRGGDGTDQLAGQGGADALDGGPGQDEIAGGMRDDCQAPGVPEPLCVEVDDSDNDRVRFDGAASGIELTLAPGWRQASGGSTDFVREVESVYGTEFDDTFTGGAGPNILLGNRGNDLLRGGGGADRVIGVGGEDVLYGGGGPDQLIGKRGQDKLYGGAGRDALFGGGGRDRCDGGSGRDTAKSCERVLKVPRAV